MTSIAQRKILIGREAQHGTPVAPDAVLRGKAEIKVVPDKIVTEADVNSFAPDRHYVGSLKAEGTLEIEGYYEHAAYLVSMALGDPLSGGIPTNLGSGRYRYTMTLAESGVYVPQYITYTIEFTDGNYHIVKAADVFATSLEVSGEAGKSWIFKADIEGAEASFPSTLGASLLAQKTTPILVSETNLYMSNLYTNIASGLVSSSLISFKWILKDFQHHKQFASSLWATGRGNSKWSTELELVLETELDIVKSEKAKLLTNDQTAIRLRSVSPNGHATGVPYLINLDGVYVLKDVDTLDERNGNNIVKLLYQGEKDTNNFTARFFIETDLAEL